MTHAPTETPRAKLLQPITFNTRKGSHLNIKTITKGKKEFCYTATNYSNKLKDKNNNYAIWRQGSTAATYA